MGLRVKTNIESVVAQRRLGETRRTLGDSLERLSSGLRINKSADDAAGLAVSERIRARVRSLDVAKRNANDGISYIQVAEGGLQEVQNIVVRMRELSAQAASDTLGNRERQFLDREFQELRQEIGRIVESTDFNGSKVLQSKDNKPIQIFVGSTNRGNDINGNPPEFDGDVDPDILTINLQELTNLEDAINSIVKDDMSIVPEDDDGGAQDLGPNGTFDIFNRLDSAQNSIASYRATLGSVQSRLNSTITNIEVSSENLQAAMSRIRDVDYASEMGRYTQAQIMTQAGVSVLTNANSTPEFVLQLLRG